MSLPASSVEKLRNSVLGQVLLPGETGYEKARRVWNGMIDRHPAVVVRAAGVADVIAAVRMARADKMLLAVRGGGHNVAGHATCDGGMVLDLSALRSVRVNPVACTARVEPGATWKDFDHETSAFGLASTGGMVSTTGVAGFTLGGGLGWLMRKHGLACDNLRSVDLVTADGRLLSASARENADLFWGVRGGGGNFGIVTSFEFELHPLPDLYGGMMLYRMADAGDVLRFYRGYAARLPDAMTSFAAIITAPPEPYIPAQLQRQPTLALAVAYAGDVAEGEALVRPLREHRKPAFERLGPLPYPVLQSLFDASAPPGMQNYWKSCYLTELSDGLIATILRFAADLPQPMAGIHIHQMGGAVKRRGTEETAFVHRDAEYCLNLVTCWWNCEQNAANIAWTRACFDAVKPFSSGVYVNFLGEEGEERVRAAYGRVYERLAALKAKYDPTNFFRLNQNVPPAGTGKPPDSAR